MIRRPVFAAKLVFILFALTGGALFTAIAVRLIWRGQVSEGAYFAYVGSVGLIVGGLFSITLAYA